jgi:glutamyl-tRNA reductase
MKARGFENIALCNRTDRKAKKLAMQENTAFFPWHELSAWHEFDVVMFATKSAEYLIRKEDIPSRLRSTKAVFDLSVPRNVEPSLESHQDVALFNIDQINQHVDKIRLLKKIEMDRIETIVKERTEKQLAVFDAKERIREELLPLSKIAVLGF